MKTKLRLKIIWESTITRIILITLVVVALVLAILLPSVLNARPKGSVVAFNRDATSGTREAFVEKVLESDKSKFSPGSNVLEASNNESMIRAVSKNRYSTGYVSFGTVARYDETGKAVLRDDVDANKLGFTTLNGISADKANVVGGDYSGQRDFNMFLRVNKNSSEYEITNYDFNTNTSTVDLSSLSDELKLSYLFYNWTIYSTEANDFIESETGELPFTPESDRVDFNILDHKDDLEQYATNTGIEANHKINIEIVGSTSANAVVDDLSSKFKNEINQLFGEDTITFTLATNGSGDAFKENVAGTQSPYIGLQSREAQTDELSNWGYKSGVDEKTYHAFAIDAILMIYNNQHLKDKTQVYDVTSENLSNLYQSNEYVQWDDLFIGGGK